jgi:hypothetical protein
VGTSVENHKRLSGDTSSVNVFSKGGRYELARITTHWREGLQLKKGTEAVRHALVGEPTSELEPPTCSSYE